MTQIVPLTYAPDVNSAWIANPGALEAISNLAPLARGSYGSVGSLYGGMDVNGTGYKYARIFRKLDGTCRFLVFSTTDIDEYGPTGVRNNRGTGYSSSTANWSAAAFGDAIIATNYIDVIQVSTGTTFGTLAGSPPKARLVAANQNFVMLADYNDGTAYPDGWWCSGVGNYLTWTPNLATQAANGRLLDVSGPIKALVPFRDMFVAFKDNAIILLEYVYNGASSVVWAARTVSNTVGTHSMHGVAELRGVLYFAHSSGIWSFDGTNLASVGEQIENTMLELLLVRDRNNGPTELSVPGASINNIIAVTDEVENVVWFFFTSEEEENVD
jgi:hypothetical protein